MSITFTHLTLPFFVRLRLHRCTSIRKSFYHLLVSIPINTNVIDNSMAMLGMVTGDAGVLVSLVPKTIHQYFLVMYSAELNDYPKNVKAKPSAIHKIFPIQKKKRFKAINVHFKDRFQQHQQHTKPVEVEQKDPSSPPPTSQKQQD